MCINIAQVIMLGSFGESMFRYVNYDQLYSMNTWSINTHPNRIKDKP